MKLKPKIFLKIADTLLSRMTVSGKLPPRKFPPGIFPPMFLNIPTRVFKFFVFSLLSPSDDFIFEASHEECDVTKFSQLNGAA